MQLHYCETPGGNFGDDMNLWFWDDIMPEWRDIHPDVTLSGIGTLINTSMLSQYPRILVCGSGAGYGATGDSRLDHVSFAWVRGPHSAALLGLAPDRALTDPACLVADLPRFAGQPERRAETVFVPHRLTARLAIDWSGVEDRTGMRVVLPQEEAVSVMERIRDAQLVIAESMHGAIVADAFRVPWIPVAISHHFNRFKWQDWTDSLGVTLQLNEALRLPRNAYFLFRNQRRTLGRIFSTKKDGKPAPARRTNAPFENPNYLEKDERDTVKALVSRMAPVVEGLLARDLRRLGGARPHLSEETMLSERKERMLARIDDIRRGKTAPA